MGGEEQGQGQGVQVSGISQQGGNQGQQGVVHGQHAGEQGQQSGGQQSVGGRQPLSGATAQTGGNGRKVFSPRRSLDDGRSIVGSSVGEPMDLFNRTLNNISPNRLHLLIKSVHQTIPMQQYIDNISYQGFNRHEFIKSALKQITPSQFLRLAVMGAIRGSNFSKIENSCINIDNDIVVLVRNQTISKTAKRKSDITILRCTASIPQWSSFFLLSSSVPPKLTTSQLHPCLQYPAAASLPMSAAIRQLHVDFCVQFSKVINGKFNANIYMAAFNNQIPMEEIPSELITQLGAQSAEQSRLVPVSGYITDAESKLVPTQ